MVSDKRLIELAIGVLPSVRAADVKKHLKNPTLEQIWERAEEQEENEREEKFAACRVEEVFPAVEADKARGGAKQPPKACLRCAGTGHLSKECPKRFYRCFKCGVLGHIAPACRNFAVKDELGRVQTQVESKKGGVVLKTKQDATQRDRMATASATIEALKKMADSKAAGAAESRKRKLVLRGKPPKRARVEHPIGVAESASDDAVEELLEYEKENSQEEAEDEAYVGLETYVEELKPHNTVRNSGAP